MLDGPGPLGRRAHHVAGGVLQEDQRRAALVAQLNELRRLDRAGRLDRPVVGNQAHAVTLNAGVPAQRVAFKGGLELQKVRAINQARDDFPRVIGLALVHRNNAHEFLRVIQRSLGGLLRRGDFIPGQVIHQLARQRNRMAVVLRKVFAQAGDAGVQFASAQRFFGGIFTNGGLDQRRAGQVNAGAAPHQDHVVRQPGYVSPARRGRAMHHGNLRYASG